MSARREYGLVALAALFEAAKAEPRRAARIRELAGELAVELETDVGENGLHDDATMSPGYVAQLLAVDVETVGTYLRRAQERGVRASLWRNGRRRPLVSWVMDELRGRSRS